MGEQRQTLQEVMETVVRHLISRGISITAMESCTAGLFASCITDTEGASAIFRGSFVTYSNEAKIRQGVPAEVIDRYGVYSCETARAMAEACRAFYGVQIGVGVTGTTGNPDPNNGDSVQGEIYYAIRWGEKECVHKMKIHTAGMTRHEIKEAAVREIAEALCGLLGICEDLIPA